MLHRLASLIVLVTAPAALADPVDAPASFGDSVPPFVEDGDPQRVPSNARLVIQLLSSLASEIEAFSVVDEIETPLTVSDEPVAVAVIDLPPIPEAPGALHVRVRFIDAFGNESRDYFLQSDGTEDITTPVLNDVETALEPVGGCGALGLDNCWRVNVIPVLVGADALALVHLKLAAGDSFSSQVVSLTPAFIMLGPDTDEADLEVAVTDIAGNPSATTTFTVSTTVDPFQALGCTGCAQTDATSTAFAMVVLVLVRHRRR